MASVPERKNMPEHFGIRIVSAEKGKVVGEIDADERHLNNNGIVHGGAYIFRASPPGRLTAVSVPLHVGRRTIVVQTQIFVADGKLAAQVTQTQLVIPRPAKE